jgi:cation-transporting ATPase I
MGLAALIGTQLAQTAWAGRRSPLVLVTAAGSFAVLVGVVQTPVVSRFFGCRPLDPLAWATVLGWSAAGAAGAELVPRGVARWQEGRVPAVPALDAGSPDPGRPAGAEDVEAPDAGDTAADGGPGDQGPGRAGTVPVAAEPV